jgi:N-acetylglucosamine kinase-like BadF-type ATPase
VSAVLAVDGGNTKTIAVVARADGSVAGVGRAGTSDIYSAPTPALAIAEIESAARSALAAAGCAPEELGAAAFSLAGADWPEDFELLERELRERLGLAVAPLVVNDALGALRAGSDDWTGVAVVAGTYNAVGARHPDGRVFHVGFWPDGAGGRDLARDGLRAVYRAELGLGPATDLTQRALALYGAGDALALLYEFTRRGGRAPHEQDRFAPAVLDAADAGDAVAQAIVAEKARILGAQARACAARLALPLAGLTVVLAGGVFTHPTERLATGTLAELPGAVAVRHAPPPVAGAVLLALDAIGADADPAALAAAVTGTGNDGRSAPWAASPSRA